jgi:prolipoprotein diacylglyceryltransferase
MFAGVERFLIESIREHGDSLYQIGEMLFSQAQMISLVLFVVGVCVLLLTQKGLLKPASR